MDPATLSKLFIIAILATTLIVILVATGVSVVINRWLSTSIVSSVLANLAEQPTYEWSVTKTEPTESYPDALIVPRDDGKPELMMTDHIVGVCHFLDIDRSTISIYTSDVHIPVAWSFDETVAALRRCGLEIRDMRDVEVAA